MKRLLLISLTLIGGASYAQVFSDGRGLTAQAKQFQLLSPKTSGKPLHLLLISDVKVVSEPQGLTMTSDRMTLVEVPDPKAPKAYLISEATAIGHVVVVKSVVSKTGKQTTHIEGSKADYSAGTAESVVKMAGPVSMTSLDESGQPTMVATGNSGVAYLEPLKQTNLNNALRRVTMEGNVHLALTQIDAKTKEKSTIRTISDHMLLENQPAGRKVTLTGNVQLLGEGFNLNGTKQAVFFIGRNGEFSLDTSGAK